MFERAQIDDLVFKAAASVLRPPAGVERVFSEPMVDQFGTDALWITIVLKPGGFDHLSGEKAIENLVAIDKALQAANIDLFPYINYTTDEEEALALLDDPES